MPWNLKISAPASSFYTRAVTPTTATVAQLSLLTVQTRFSELLLSRRCRAEITLQIPENPFHYAGTGQHLILLLHRQT